MDETPIYLNMHASTTVQPIGLKKVNIRAQRQEIWRITVILAIIASKKIAPLLIFKHGRKRYER